MFQFFQVLLVYFMALNEIQLLIRNFKKKKKVQLTLLHTFKDAFGCYFLDKKSLFLLKKLLFVYLDNFLKIIKIFKKIYF